MMKNKVSVLGWLFLVLMSPYISQAQLVLKPIIKSSSALRQFQTQDNTRDSIPINLPFWDDFSYSDSHPDTLWVSSSGVLINNTWSVNSPTIGVATFDGTDASGAPYAIDRFRPEVNDSLVSRPINLSIEDPNIVLSFYYQKAGLGREPSNQDPFSLYFRSEPNAEWELIWQVNGNEVPNTDEFFHERFTLADRFKTPEFQFRFDNIGSPTGAFDIWHLDYVYLNARRETSIENEPLPDQAIASPLTDLLGEYTVLPKNQFDALMDNEFSAPNFELSNFDDRDFEPDYQFNLYRLDNLFINVNDSTTESRITKNLIHTETVTNTLVLPGTVASRRLYSLTSLKRDDLVEIAGLDSVSLESEIILTNSANGFFPDGQGGELNNSSYNYRLNDTIRNQITLDDQLGYDDGTAEIAVGVNKINGRVAQFFTIPKPDVVTGFVIHFPVVGDLPGEILSFRAAIVKELTDSVAGPDIIIEGDYVIQTGTERNRFTTYEFPSFGVVDSSFFLVIEQRSPEFFPIGLDANNDNSDRIFFQIGESWEQNNPAETMVQGTLMLRPIFGETEGILSVKEDVKLEEVVVYPNPATDRVKISGAFDFYRLRNLDGKTIIRGPETVIEVNQIPEGIYFLEISMNKESIFKKIIIRH